MSYMSYTPSHTPRREVQHERGRGVREGGGGGGKRRQHPTQAPACSCSANRKQPARPCTETLNSQTNSTHDTNVTMPMRREMGRPCCSCRLLCCDASRRSRLVCVCAFHLHPMLRIHPCKSTLQSKRVLVSASTDLFVSLLYAPLAPKVGELAQGYSRNHDSWAPLCHPMLSLKSDPRGGCVHVQIS